MNCFIKTNSSELLGSGHFVRCLNLGYELRKNGYSVQYVYNSLLDRHLETLMRDKFPVQEIFPNDEGRVGESKSILNFARTLGFNMIDWIVVDDYESDQNWDLDALTICKGLLVIEDRHKSQRVCNIVLDMNYRTKEFISRLEGQYDETKLLIGPKFALLDNSYGDTQPIQIRDFCNMAHRVFVYFGSQDNHSLTLQAIHTLLENFPNTTARIVVQSNNPSLLKIIELVEQNSEKFEIFLDPQSLSEIMESCTVSFGAGGISLWERISLGLFCIVVATAENQVEPLYELQKDNLILYLGKAETFTRDKLLEAFSYIVSHGREYERYRELCRTISDGHGCERVVKAMKRV